MFATTLSRFAIALPHVLRIGAKKSVARQGKLPTWVDDPQLSEQLLKDTRLTLEELGVRPVYDDKKPFFMQQNFW